MILTQRRRHALTWMMLGPVLVLMSGVLVLAGVLKGLGGYSSVVHDPAVPAVDASGEVIGGVE